MNIPTGKSERSGTLPPAGKNLRDRLTEGLLHEDQFVREACFRYWEKRLGQHRIRR